MVRVTNELGTPVMAAEDVVEALVGAIVLLALSVELCKISI